jgi:hypothetical protein
MLLVRRIPLSPSMARAILLVTLGRIPNQCGEYREHRRAIAIGIVDPMGEAFLGAAALAGVAAGSSGMVTHRPA